MSANSDEKRVLLKYLEIGGQERYIVKKRWLLLLLKTIVSVVKQYTVREGCFPV